MDIELLEVFTELWESIDRMNASSTTQVKTTNWLTGVILAFTVAGVAVAVIALRR